MAKVNTTISLDADVKTAAQSLLADFGLDLSTAVNIFLRQMVYQRAIPFDIQREYPTITPDAGSATSRRTGS